MAEILAAVALMVSFALPLYFWRALPASVPIHFGINGHADSFGTKSALLLLPLVSLFFYALLSLLKRFPHIYNYPWKITPLNAYRQFQLAKGFITAIKAEMIWIFVYIEWVQVGVALGEGKIIDPFFLPVVIGLILGTIAIYFYLAYHSK